MDLRNLINGIETRANEAIKEEQGDYYGDDGLLYCGKCHTPKQCRVELFGEIRTPRCLCKCAAEQRDKEEAELKRIERERQARKNQLKCFERYNAEKNEYTISKLIKCTFEVDDKTNERITNIALKYVENFNKAYKDGKGLLFFGAVDTGKTFMAACIANALLSKGYTCRVTSFTEIVKEMQSEYGAEQRIVNKLNNFDLLVIDDLGVERDSGYMNEQVQYIVDSRYRAGLPLIVTTNLTSEELKNPQDLSKQRTYSRLLEMCIPLEVKGIHRRKDKLKADYNEYKDILGL